MKGKRIKQKLLSFLLAFTMVLGLAGNINFTVMAGETEYETESVNNDLVMYASDDNIDLSEELEGGGGRRVLFNHTTT